MVIFRATAGFLAGAVVAPVVAAAVATIGYFVLFLLVFLLGVLMSLPVLFYVIAFFVGLAIVAVVPVIYYLTYVGVGYTSGWLVPRVMRGVPGIGVVQGVAIIASLVAMPLFLLLVQRLVPFVPSDLAEYLDLAAGRGLPGLRTYDWSLWAWANLVVGTTISVLVAKEEVVTQVAKCRS